MAVTGSTRTAGTLRCRMAATARRAALGLGVAAILCGLCGAHASSALAFAGTTAGVSGTEGAAVSGTIATFTDGTLLLPCTSASQYTATVDWGDGTTSAGGVSQASSSLLGACNYTVNASHTYAEAGAYTYSVTVGGPNGTLNTGARTATIADAPLSAAGIDFSATKGTSFTTTVATFGDANSLAKPGDFSATISWGDGSTAAGTITAVPGGFAVAGTHTYATTGDLRFTVAIHDNGGSQISATATASVLATPTVTPPPVTTGPPTTKPPSTKPLKLGLSRPVAARGGSVVVGVSCPSAAHLCRGRITVTTVVSPHSKFAVLHTAHVLGTSLFIVPGGSKAELSVRPKRAVVAELRRAGAIAVSTSASSSDAATGGTETATLKTTLRLSAAG
jgi:PKD repeat protein